MRLTSSVLGSTSLLVALCAIGCTNDPVYLPGPTQLEGGLDDGMGEPVEARASLVLPINLETMEDADERAELQATVDPAVEVPYVRVGDLEISVEWTIKNLTDMPGSAMVQLNGANQFFEYDPSLLVLSSDDEAPPTPGLAGDTPIAIPALGSISGLFREDELREASIDLDQITRGNINPFRTRLTISKNLESFAQLAPLTYDADGEPLPQAETGLVFPRVAIPQLLRIDLVFKPDRHMVLEYAVRVRDVRGELMNEMLLDAPAGELQGFAPAPFAVAP